MSCGRVPESWPEHASPLVILPGDPKPLRRALARQRPAQPSDEELPPPPDEEPT